MSGARFRQGGARAFYQPATDEIHLPPPSAFPSAGGYYNVALHELTHWTGHPSRCHRDLAGRFGDAAYAAEELIAELGAAYLCAHCRLDGELRHARLPGSPGCGCCAVTGARSSPPLPHAQRAADYVLKLTTRTAAIARQPLAA